MAGDWIKMRIDLPRRPQVVAMASMVGCPRSTLIGGLFVAWSLFDANTDNGKLRFYTPDLLDSEAELPGLAAAMAHVGWLVAAPDGLLMPGFDEHMGECSRRREKEAKRKAEQRKRKREEAAEVDGPGHVPGTGTGHTWDMSQMSRAREEERREDESIKDVSPAALTTAPLSDSKTKDKANKGTRWEKGRTVPEKWIQWAEQRGELTKADIDREAESFAD